MEHIFIINPVSGTANAETLLVPQIKKAAEELNVPYKIIKTQYAGHAREIAKKLAESGKELRLYACGGDGTLNEVVEGSLGFQNIETGCVPCGSGNDFVRNFGTKDDFLNIKDLIQGKSCVIDLIKTQHGIATSICSAGLDALVAYGIPKFRRIPFAGGETAYKLSILTSLCTKLGHRLHIEADGEIFEGEYLMIAVCNGMTYGGGFKAAPCADMQDGLLDLVLVKKISRLKIAGVVNTYKQGNHIKGGEVIPSLKNLVTYRRVKNVSVQVMDNHPIVINQDGECAKRMSLKATTERKAVRVILPRSIYMRSKLIKETV